jgi:hypothetical protein
MNAKVATPQQFDRINAALAAEEDCATRGPGLQPVRASAFVRDLQPVDPVLDAVPASARGRLISITGPTGAGKTTLAAAAEVSIATGQEFGGMGVARGRVLVLCGENPDDYNMHLVATMQERGLEPADLDDILVVPGRFDIDAGFDWLQAEVESFGDLTAVFVDTSAAYYNGDDDNGNVQQYRHAAMLRTLTGLPGRPVVFVLCHPIKNATRENLVPRGGGAFLNEVDANLTVWKDDASLVTLHWAGKMRGAYFEPIRFELAARDLDGYVDGRGRNLKSAVARPVPGERAEQLEAKAMDDENRLLMAMQRKPDGSIADLALACGWSSGAGTPSKSRAHRVLQKLEAQGLAEKNRLGGWRLTPKGKREADQL